MRVLLLHENDDLLVKSERLAGFLEAQLARHRTDCTALSANKLTDDAWSSAEIIVYLGLTPADQAGLFTTMQLASKALLWLRPTSDQSKAGVIELHPPPPLSEGHFNIGKINMPYAALDHPEGSHRMILNRCVLVLRHAANWQRRKRLHHDSLRLAEIYAEAPLFACAF